MFDRMYLAVAILIVAAPTIVSGETWTSPDGVVSVATPSPTKFESIPMSTDNLLALWMTADDSLRLAVVRLAMPEEIRLEERAAMEAFGKEFGVEQPVGLPVKTVAGHTVWGMTASGPMGNYRQSFVQHNRHVYKLISIASRDAVPLEIDAFHDSLAILQPEDPAPSNAPESDDSVRLGRERGATVARALPMLALIGLLVMIFCFVNRKKKVETPPNSP